jgi:hypothetical protein
MNDVGPAAAAWERGAVASIQQRIDALEHENQRLQRRGFALLIAVAVLLGLATAVIVIAGRHGLPGMVPAVSEARQYVVRDRSGTVRGAWGVDDSGAVRIVLQDGGGHPRAKLSVLRDGSSGFSLIDSADRTRAVLGLLPDQTATLVLADSSGRTRTVLSLNPDGGSSLVFADRGGAMRAGVGVDVRGVGSITVDDRGTGEARAAVAEEPAPVDSQPTAAAKPATARTKRKP